MAFFTRACRNSVVRMATGNGLDVRGIEFRLGRDFSHLSSPVLGSTQAPIKLGTWSVAGGKVAGAWCWSPTPSIAEVEERIELYLFSPFRPL